MTTPTRVLSKTENDARRVRLQSAAWAGSLSGEWCVATRGGLVSIVKAWFLLPDERVLVLGTLEECRAWVPPAP